MNDEDYSVTWNEVKNIVDSLLDGNKKVPMGEINTAVDIAWERLYLNQKMKYKRAEMEQQNFWINEMLR